MNQKLLFIKCFFPFLFIQTFCFSQAPAYTWVKGLGGINSVVNVKKCAISGNVYITGQFSGTVDFDPGTGAFNLSSAGQEDIFVCKIDATGNFIWAKSIGGTGSDGGSGIAADALGNTYISGVFSGRVDFDPGTSVYELISQGFYDTFILKLDDAGNLIWAKNLGGNSLSSAVACNDLAIDNAQNVYTTGYFFGSADFDPGTGTYDLTALSTADLFISKLDSTGNFVWAKKIGNTNSSGANGYSIATDAAGNVVTTGMFYEIVDFDPGPGIYNLNTAVSGSIFISKLDPAGNFLWAKNMGGSPSDAASSIKTDIQGNIYTTGSFRGVADFDPGTGAYYLSSSGEEDVFISKLDAAGNFVLAKSIGSISSENGNSVTVDNTGNIYTTGVFSGTVDFNPGIGSYNLTASGDKDVFISTLDASGNFLWAQRIGGNSTTYSVTVNLDAALNVFLTGVFSGVVDFNPGASVNNMTATGESDSYILKLMQPALPLELVSFSCKALNKQKVQLHWQTALEQNTAQFIIERSSFQNSFSSIDTVAADGNISSVRNYSTLDEAPLLGTNYYRLKIEDKDHAFTHSKIVEVKITSNINDLNIYPNPVKDKFQVQVYGENESATFKIIDATGKVIKQGQVQLNGNNSFLVDVHFIPAGKYYFLLQRKKASNCKEFLKIE